ncbi:glycosyltransferase family 1 protein [Cohnella laeviribosi]|jgi:hypothetical protein|uniref:glycosyltransferase family 1 protein n=1 Tax=Cohnella laeviribosi TaxID=380174 RepID=UPI00036B2581|nr:glycosyltransferase family 1 protein [Cohnella laeviribosi]
MNRILFITTRNIFNTCGELRLIKNRTKALYENWNVVTDFIAINNRKKINSKNEEIGSGSTITVIPCNNYNVVSIYNAFNKSKKLLSRLFINNHYKCVILSGIGTFSLAPFIKEINNDIPIVADIHSAKEELLEFNKGNLIKKIYRTLMYSYIKYSESKYLNQLDGALVVSNALAEYLNKEYHLNNFKHYVVPCYIENNYSLEKRLFNREKYRTKYNIEPDELLFIYSGGTSPWQCINESIKIFLSIKSDIPEKSKMLILSHNIEEIKPMINNCSDILTDSVNANEVNHILCAGDFAFLIRENFVTNNVAYPNKFLEYVQSGMMIITTPYVFDVAKQVEEFGLGIIIDFNNYKEKILDYISRGKKEIDDKRENLLNRLNYSETLQKFVYDNKLL